VYHSKEFPNDTFTEHDVLSCLERAGLKFKKGSRYILTQCPLHEDKNPSAQIYKDDWFVQCHAVCGRFHITKAFPELRPNADYAGQSLPSKRQERVANVTEQKYKSFDLMSDWQKMPPIPRDHHLKTIPLEVLDELGWRWDTVKNSYFIPYFSASRTSIPFAQWRHLSGERRFTFLKDAKPTCYGTWNLNNDTLFLVEGTSDGAVLEYANVPWIAAPSAAAGELVKRLAVYCSKNNIKLVYGGDNDAAGHKLREALDEVTSYRVKQPPKKYKDWGDFLVAEGIERLQDYCFEELFPTHQPETDVELVQRVFPGAEELELVGPPKSKEQSSGPLKLF
jgi:hypothetical protein